MTFGLVNIWTAVNDCNFQTTNFLDRSSVQLMILTYLRAPTASGNQGKLEGIFPVREFAIFFKNQEILMTQYFFCILMRQYIFITDCILITLNVIKNSFILNYRMIFYHDYMYFFRWFKFTLKPPIAVARDNLRLAIWDTSFWNFFVKFGHRTPQDICQDLLWPFLTFVHF